MQTFDLIVIGAGSGLNLAVEAANQGLKTAIIEKGPLGGTCLNRGCIPSKIVIHSADVADKIKRAKLFGLSASLTGVNFKKVTNRANLLVDADAKMIERSLEKETNPKLFKGTAKFVGKYLVQVGKKTLKGKKFVIGAGARPFIPPIPGLDKVPYMTSTEALRQTKLPKSMIVIGGGYIGCELGHFYAALGCKVTLIQKGPLLIPREDEEVATLFTKLWKERYNVIINGSAVKVEKHGKGITVVVKQDSKTKRVTAEKLLVATGVKPNSDVLQVEKTGIEVNKRGFIKTNACMRTSVRNIWALGDIAGKYMFKHSANLEADYVLTNILGKKRKVDYFPMPHAMFSSPQIAGVGLTEQEARGKIDYIVGKYEYKSTGMGEALAEEHGFCKLIVSRKHRKIIGCHIIGPHASVLLHEVLIAMKAKQNGLDLLRSTVHIHPALNEVVHRAAFNVRL